MNKIILSCVACIAFVNNAFSQSTKPNTLSLSLGPAFAIGQFASKEFNSEKSGFAKPGGALALSYTRFVSKQFGVSININAQHNPMNVEALEDEYNKSFQGFSSWSFDKRSWLYAAALLGATGQFPLDKKDKFAFVAKAMAGYAFAKSPGIEGNASNTTGMAKVEQDKAKGSGFTYCGGAGINYTINKSVFLTSLVCYNGAPNMKFKDVKTVTTAVQGTIGMPDYQAYQYMTTRDEKQTISSVNVMVGVGLRF